MEHFNQFQVNETISDSWFAIDKHFVCVGCNQKAEEFCQLPRERIIGRKVSLSLPGYNNSPFETVFRRVLNERGMVNEDVFVPGINSWFEIRAYATDFGISMFVLHKPRVFTLNQTLETHKLNLEATVTRLTELNSRLMLQVDTDGLTGLTNHRAFYDRLTHEVARCHRYQCPVSLIMLDVDYFKTYNDTYGHPAGDHILRQLASLLLATTRSTDLVARYGGEEFAIILFHVDATAPEEIAERLRATIEANEWPNRKITVSVGVASLNERIPDAMTLISKADEALYAAKDLGRNSVVSYENITNSEFLFKCREDVDHIMQSYRNNIMEAAEDLDARLLSGYEGAIEGLSRALDLRDHETEGHSRRVTELLTRSVSCLGLTEEERRYYRWGAMLHDIGKLGIPDRILHKPGPLTDAEMAIMRRHPQMGYELLCPLPFLRPALDIPYYHHEKWDGTGYPCGLKRDEIPMSARLFAVIDVWDALSNDRPYRKAWPMDRVYDYIREQSGKHFDPRAVKIVLDALNQEFEVDYEQFYDGNSNERSA